MEAYIEWLVTNTTIQLMETQGFQHTWNDMSQTRQSKSCCQKDFSVHGVTCHKHDSTTLAKTRVSAHIEWYVTNTTVQLMRTQEFQRTLNDMSRTRHSKPDKKKVTIQIDFWLQQSKETHKCSVWPIRVLKTCTLNWYARSHFYESQAWAVWVLSEYVQWHTTHT